MNYYVGIDGGGTSCRARIRNQQGEWVGEAKVAAPTSCSVLRWRCVP